MDRMITGNTGYFPGGADNPRSITVRYRPSSGEWFLWEQAVLADIKKPIAEDAWA